MPQTQNNNGMKYTAHLYYWVAITGAIITPYLYLHNSLTQVKIDIVVIKQMLTDHMGGEKAGGISVVAESVLRTTDAGATGHHGNKQGTRTTK